MVRDLPSPVGPAQTQPPIFCNPIRYGWAQAIPCRGRALAESQGMRRPDLPSRRIGRLIVLLLAVAAAACSERPQRPRVAGGEPDRGRAAIERYGCAACHTIPGLPAYGANVGPPLLNLAERGYLAG